ncbi:RsmB/NOP family class I SAM-dependent RNA methyltransferase [Spiribacter halobius]|uniref:SAM-dependent MTase RsmB/NOP-type domain-containing protein n=1 Tax=Sediminicurvatus halobius TaxID=2182432 RepID=A0A2U2N6Z1_9GAMM|nr:RsmB/NOP family class I SAM-dependent RNA methyltransferase [Spiribacter halobius]PWG64848.1 hypothetical protein DEM34_03360 [Spiribacter halobius]UEX78300.1 RsmB/NOP family class I SAM-dependent RNA methyltransferase [Spiribacter halobius]
MRSRHQPRDETAPGWPSVLPAPLGERLATLLGAEGRAAWLAQASAAPVTAFRVNTLLADAPAVLAELHAAGLDPAPVPGCPGCFTVPPGQRRALTETAAVAAGRVYIQTPSSVLAASRLGVRPGDEVLDLAAAPGGKTLVLAAALGGAGRLAAVERSRPRFYRLKRNLAAHGAGWVHTYLKDGTAVGRLTPERFDRVLLDAPCSAEARIRSDEPATFADWGPRRHRRLARLQGRLLASGLAALKPGGRLLYATCTFAPEENEAVLDTAVGGGGLRVLPLGELPCATRPGLTEWEGRRYHPDLRHAARILPQGPWEGFFIALLEKQTRISGG